MSSATVADIDLPHSQRNEGVILDRLLTFEKHVSAVARSCNFHNQAIRHIRHLLMMTTQLAQTIACSLILSRLDYCNVVLHGIPSGNIQKQCSTDRSPGARRSHTKPLLCQQHYMPVQHRITYKLAVLTYKVRSHRRVAPPPQRGGKKFAQPL